MPQERSSPVGDETPSPCKGEGWGGGQPRATADVERRSPPALLLAEQSDLPFSRGGQELRSNSSSRSNKFPNDFKAGHFLYFGFEESSFFFAEVVLLSRPVLSRPRGVRVVTNVGRDAMDADARAGRAAKSADGEVVWSCSPVLFSFA
jgi:hypothetical protein